MRRKVVAAIATVAAALAITVPAVAKSGHSLRLVMGGRVTHKVKTGAAFIAGGSGSVIAHQGFECEVTIGQGPGDATYVNRWTRASTEFYSPFTAGVLSLASVTTNCVGQLPKGTPHANATISHVTANCGQINPLDPTKFISGVGITTTFRNGMYSESCNTANFGL
jgi:hypothetical protein